MGNMVYRVFALTVAAAGVLLFAYMMQVTYNTAPEWDHKLIALGMPLSFLLPLLGAMMATLGLVMFAHALHRGQSERYRR